MKTCGHCGNQTPDEAVYCPACKTRFQMPSGSRGSGSTVSVIMVIVAIAGIIAAIAIPNFSTEAQGAKQKRAMREVRKIVLAVQCYATDIPHFPVVKGSTHPGWNMVPVTDLKKILEPDYIKAIPDPDPWGNQYSYGFTPDGKHFVVLCKGQDKKIDSEGVPELGSKQIETHCYENDIIWIDDAFMKKPEGKQQSCGSN